jgi:hypothetical protein
MSIEKAKMRGRIHQYRESGHVERIEDGVFRITNKWKEAVG